MIIFDGVDTECASATSWVTWFMMVEADMAACMSSEGMSAGEIRANKCEILIMIQREYDGPARPNKCQLGQKQWLAVWRSTMVQ